MSVFSISLILKNCSLHITKCFVIKDVLKCRSLKYLWESVSLHVALLSLTAFCFTLRTANSLFPRSSLFKCEEVSITGFFPTSECPSFCGKEHKSLIVKIAQYPPVFWWMAISLLCAFGTAKHLNWRAFKDLFCLLEYTGSMIMNSLHTKVKSEYLQQSRFVSENRAALFDRGYGMLSLVLVFNEIFLETWMKWDVLVLLTVLNVGGQSRSSNGIIVQIHIPCSWIHPSATNSPQSVESSSAFLSWHFVLFQTYTLAGCL